MDDRTIISLYLERKEDAISATRRKYGSLLRSLALRIAGNAQDAEECENDTYLSAWNSIPPTVPSLLSAYLSRIVRNHALKRLRASSAQKRGEGEAILSLDELGDCIPSESSFAEELEAKELADLIDAFLRTLPAQSRVMFVCRYFHCFSVAEIAERQGFTQSKVKMTLLRTRQALAAHLKQKGVFL